MMDRNHEYATTKGCRGGKGKSLNWGTVVDSWYQSALFSAFSSVCNRLVHHRLSESEGFDLRRVIRCVALSKTEGGASIENCKP